MTSGSDHDGFASYVPTTVDAGDWMFIASFLYCLLCILLLPVLVIIGRRWEKKRREGIWDNIDFEGSELCAGNETRASRSLEEVGQEAIEVDLTNGINILGSPTSNESEQGLFSRNAQTERKVNSGVNKVQGILGGPKSVLSSMSAVSLSSVPSGIGPRSRRHGKRHRSNLVSRPDMFQRALQSEEHQMVEQIHKPILGNGNHSEISGCGISIGHRNIEASTKIRKIKSIMSIDYSVTKYTIDDLLPDDAADANDPGREKPQDEHEGVEETICCGPNAILSKKKIVDAVDYFFEIVNPDYETGRLLRLGIPLTISEIADAIWDSITVAVLSNYIGTNELTAYVLANLLLGISDTFTGGISGSLETVCSHAVGAGNYKLVGEYLQIATVSYVIIGSPFLLVWCFYMDDVLLWMGVGEEIATIGLDYTRIAIVSYLLEGIGDGCNTILDITGKEVFGSILDIVHGAIDCIIVWILAANLEGFSLFHVGIVHASTELVFFLLWFVIAACKGWLDLFWEGMFKTFALKNKPAVSNLVRTSLPLCFGELLEYGEWEILTFFVASLGPAEVATWGILGSIWELFEAATSGLGASASIRVAFHLGKGRPPLAKMSAYKSLFLCFALSLLSTSFFFILGEDITPWFTKDPTLQEMLNNVLPMLGMGNVMMVFGMVSWSLVGSQGRYRLATTISVISSWFVTLPLATLFAIVLKLDLTGIVASLLIGYSTTGLILAVVLLQSDWAHLSKTILEYNRTNGIDMSDDSESESSSSSEESTNSGRI